MGSSSRLSVTMQRTIGSITSLHTSSDARHHMALEHVNSRSRSVPVPSANLQCCISSMSHDFETDTWLDDGLLRCQVWTWRVLAFVFGKWDKVDGQGQRTRLMDNELGVTATVMVGLGQWRNFGKSGGKCCHCCNGSTWTGQVL